MTRSCIALTLLLLVFTISLYAIRNAQGHPPLDAQFGAARHGICPLLGDDFHRCGFGLLSHPPQAAPSSAEEGIKLAEQLCPLAFLDEPLDEGNWRAEARRSAGRDVCIVAFIPLASSVEPPVDPYPLEKLPGRKGSREVNHSRYLSGHDPLYDVAVYGSGQVAPVRFEPERVLSVELVEACRRPMREHFAWEDSVEANFGYRPAQLDQGLGSRGAVRSLAAIPARWHEGWRNSATVSQLECQLAHWSDVARRELDAAPWLIAWLQHQPGREVQSRPMVTEQVRITPRHEVELDETPLVPPVTELPVTELSVAELSVTELPEANGCHPGEMDEVCPSIVTRQPLPATRRLVVESLADSLDQTGMLLRNASRQLRELVKN
jgi:hypothetical protein